MPWSDVHPCMDSRLLTGVTESLRTLQDWHMASYVWLQMLLNAGLEYSR